MSKKTIVNSVPPLPEDWKIFGKYIIKHADGTPLKGKSYFVLRLDSDDPEEAARVDAAMSAYKGENSKEEAHWGFLKYDLAACSKCGETEHTPFDTTSEAKENWGELYPYCPHCGAKMDLSHSPKID